VPDRTVRERIAADVRRIVVKIGTGAICRADGRLNRRAVTTLAHQIAAVMKSGVSVTLVASGAIGVGMAELDLAARPRTLPMLQAAAAAGQGRLMQIFHDAFARHRVKVAQVLVTRDAFEDRTRYLNIRNTLQTLAECGVLPILNENDAVSVEEIRYGDNDIIAAHVTNMLSADLMVLLTVVDGVMKDGRVVNVLEQIDQAAMDLVTAERSGLGSGGMASKLSAADLVTRAGEVAVIANAHAPKVLERLVAGRRVGTMVVPARRKMSSRRRWIGQAARPAGRIVVDSGAARALAERGKSLLPSGVTGVSGTFEKGATVRIVDAGGREIARGLSNYSAEQIDRIKGLRSSAIVRALGDKPYDEIIHRNNMTLVE